MLKSPKSVIIKRLFMSRLTLSDVREALRIWFSSLHLFRIDADVFFDIVDRINITWSRLIAQAHFQIDIRYSRRQRNFDGFFFGCKGLNACIPN